MSSVRSLFPGAMGPDGFISCFDHLLPERDLRRMIVLKGGPGVGKSTFMRRVHAALCPDGQPSTLYFCSGDPDSLDAVAVPHRGFLILDGTAPHVVGLGTGVRNYVNVYTQISQWPQMAINFIESRIGLQEKAYDLNSVAFAW